MLIGILAVSGSVVLAIGLVILLEWYAFNNWRPPW